MACDQSRTTVGAARCACEHLLVIHEWDPKKKIRRACSHMDEKGQCPCKQPH